MTAVLALVLVGVGLTACEPEERGAGRDATPSGNGISSIPSSVAPSSGSVMPTEIPTSSPPASTDLSDRPQPDKWTKTLSRLGSRIGVEDINSPEMQFESARMTGVWRGHAVALAYYRDAVHGTPGEAADSLDLGALTAELVDAPIGFRIAILTCSDGRYFEIAVLNERVLTTKSVTLLGATKSLGKKLATAARCRDA